MTISAIESNNCVASSRAINDESETDPYNLNAQLTKGTNNG